MDTSKSKRSPQELFNNKKEFSNNLHARNLKGIKEISTHTDNIKIVNHEDKRLVLNAINFYYYDLSDIIFQLRQLVVRIIGDEKSVRDLQNVIAELSKIVLSVQELLNLDIEKIKIQLKVILSNINSQVKKLVQIIEYDDLHEYKQNILDSQLDMVIYTETLKLYVRLHNLSLAEVEARSHEIIEKMKNNLQQIKNGHQVHTDDFLHYMRHSVQHIQKLLNYLRKLTNTEDFENEERVAFKKIESVGDDFMIYILEALRSENPMESMLDVMDHCGKNLADGCSECQNILQSDNVVLKDLIIYLYIFGQTGLNAMNISLEDGIMKK